jgi:hypothetical protein
VSGSGRQERAPRDPGVRNEAETSLGTRSSLSWASKTIKQMIIVSSFIYPQKSNAISCLSFTSMMCWGLSPIQL